MDNQVYIGGKKIRLESIDSTNSYLKSIIAKSAPICEGTVIMAYNQYKGRGQQYNNWISESGKNITMSFFVNPMLKIDDFFLLNKIFSLSIQNYLREELSIPIYIKWPNEFIGEHKKLCGLLIENMVSHK
ncbi:MAG: biotin--[acetyl-CoA-carboxylase] ligase [Solitalea-like symbiont of Acarus siro]